MKDGWDAIQEDLRKLQLTKRNSSVLKPAKRIIGIVPEDYFEFRNLCCTTSTGAKRCLKGVRYLDIPDAVLNTQSYWTGDAHEIGHTFTLKDEYEPNGGKVIAQCPALTKEGNIIDENDGYWLDGATIDQRKIKNTLGFMGKFPEKNLGLHNGPIRWVTKGNWETLISQLDKAAPDPPMIFISIKVSAEDHAA